MLGLSSHMDKLALNTLLMGYQLKKVDNINEEIVFKACEKTGL